MKTITINNVFDTQYRPYAAYDNERSIPNLIDGLKITQRKILHTCVAKNITSDYKVAQLASLTSNFTEYHHGEQGIGGVICTLAQNFVGANNLNFLEPIGQFGSRLSPIPAAHRYIFTKLSKNFRTFFKKEDDIILEYLYDDDTKIEPNYFIPMLPGILLNSSQGIGTGFASTILSRNHIELADYIKSVLVKSDSSKYKLLPYFDGFTGKVEHIEGNQYKFHGIIKRISATQIKITELPIGMYLDDIKKQLNKLSDLSFIKDYDDNSTEESFDIDVYFQRGILIGLNDDELLLKLKLTTTVTENLTCWLPTGKLRKFDNVQAIIKYFIDWRLEKYTVRISKLLELVDIDILNISERIRFIKFYLQNVDKFKDNSKKDLEIYLDQFGFSMSMLELKMYNLTKDKIEELDSSLIGLNKYKTALLKTTNLKLYTKELGEL